MQPHFIRHARSVARLSPERQRQILGQRRQAAPWETGQVGVERQVIGAPVEPLATDLGAIARDVWRLVCDAAPLNKWPSRSSLMILLGIGEDRARLAVEDLISAGYCTVAETTADGRPVAYRLLRGEHAGAVMRTVGPRKAPK